MRMLCWVAAVAVLALGAGTAAADLYVPGDYSTIQEAIDAASPSETIHVAADTYEEQLYIYKDVNIQGAGIGQTIVLSPENLTLYFTTSADNYPIVFFENIPSATIQGLTVDGAGRGNANYRFVGVGFDRAGGSVIDCEIVGITDTPFSGAQHGNALYAYNNEGDPRVVNVMNCQVDDFQKGGLIFNGAVGFGNVSGCVVTGVGPTGAIASNGIQFGWGSSGSVVGCDVSYNSYTGTGWTSCGILCYDGGTVDVTGSIVTECETGVMYITTMGTFDDNTVAATAAGVGLPTGDWWYGLGIDDQGAGGPKVQAYDELPGGDRGGRTAVQVYDCRFHGDGSSNSVGVGVWAQSGDDLAVTMSGCEVYDWDYGIDVWDDGSAVPDLLVFNSCFSGNVSYAVSNESTGPTLTMAESNWWGDPSGPSGAGPGTGDAVSDFVDYEPWLTEDPCGGSSVEMKSWGSIKSMYR